MWHFLLYWTGGTDASGPIYLELSGFMGSVSILGAIVVWYKHHKCVSCFRIAHHQVNRTPYKTCHKHATIDNHDIIRMNYKRDYPDQHKLLSEEENDT